MLIKKYLPPKLVFKIGRIVNGYINYKKWKNIDVITDKTYPVLYFGKKISATENILKGGDVKLHLLSKFYKVSEKCNILYLVSSSYPVGAAKLIKKAKQRGIKFVWNQNGVSYPASNSVLWKQINDEMKLMLHQADYVIYQSEFCKNSADKFLGKAKAPFSIIYNCTDTDIFKPRSGHLNKTFTILLAGNQRKHRIIIALHSFAEVKKNIPQARLIVTGRLLWDNLSEVECRDFADQLSNKLEITSSVDFVGEYNRKQAPEIFAKADILLHPQIMDASPGTVIEALACGLPVVFYKNGGTPELVGNAGIGIKNESDYYIRENSSPAEFAASIIKIHCNKELYSLNARKRAVELFSKENFVEAHSKIFNQL